MLVLARQEWLLIASIAFVGIYGLIWALMMRKRSKALAKLALEIGLSPWNYRLLPPDLTLYGTDLQNLSKAFHIYQGVVDGVQVVFFDCRIGQGKGSWLRTALAVRRTLPFWDRRGLDTEIVLQESGSWTLMFRPKGLFAFRSGLTSVDQLHTELNYLLLSKQ